MRRALLFCVAWFACGAVNAQVSTMEWFCSVDNSVPAIVCVRDGFDPVAEETAAAEPLDNGAGLRQALFAPGKGPNVSRLVREQPHRFGHPFWTIPLLSPADEEDELVATLAQSVMCGREARCQAHLMRHPLRTALR